MKRKMLLVAVLIAVLAGTAFAQGNVGDEFVLVEGGTFLMGIDSGERNERPVHKVTVDSFYMCKHEVTREEYGNIMCSAISGASGASSKLPQSYVSFFDAIEYCIKRSVAEGLAPCYKWTEDDGYVCDFNANGYRLPTEAEWEYAAKGGSKDNGKNPYSGSQNIDSVAWYGDNRGSDNHDVMTKAPNALGLYDMSGGVWEWCWDYYGSYPSKAQTNPTGPASGKDGRILRGGSIMKAAEDCRVTSRNRMAAWSNGSSDYSPDAFGLRLVRSASPKASGSAVIQATPSQKDVDFVLVDGGRFLMGEENNEYTPAHKVTVDSFFMSTHEVTQSEFMSLMYWNPRYMDFEFYSEYYGNELPVRNVTWYDAVDYCNRRSLAEGLKPCYKGNWKDGYTCDFKADGYRLPTEAEWEYAAGGGAKRKEPVDREEQDNAEEDGEAKANVPNELGIYNMCVCDYDYWSHGSVREWCWDWKGNYSSKSQKNPVGPVSGDSRVVRGGSVTKRHSEGPANRGYFGEGGFVGTDIRIRLVRTATKKAIVQSKSAKKGKFSFGTKLLPNDFVEVKGGKFRMGGKDGGDNALPVHKVKLSGFYMCKHEVTQAEYKNVVGENPSWYKDDNLPVDYVTWYDAVEYCNKRSVAEGLAPCYAGNRESGYTCDFSADGYRLPTEAEWEYAARGGAKGKKTVYSGSDDIDSVAWYEGNSEKKPHAVMTKSPNELGLYDMTGNEMEWCWDWYEKYTTKTQKNPVGPESGSERVMRGGNCHMAERCEVVTRAHSELDVHGVGAVSAWFVPAPRSSSLLRGQTKTNLLLEKINLEGLVCFRQSLS